MKEEILDVFFIFSLVLWFLFYCDIQAQNEEFEKQVLIQRNQITLLKTKVFQTAYPFPKAKSIEEQLPWLKKKGD